MLNHIYSKVYNYTKNIKPSPNPYYMLEKFYGNLSIQEYRALLKNERLFLVVDKPLTRVMPELHEDNDDFIINNKIIPSNASYNVKKRLQQKNNPKSIFSARDLDWFKLEMLTYLFFIFHTFVVVLHGRVQAISQLLIYFCLSGLFEIVLFFLRRMIFWKKVLLLDFWELVS